MRIRFPQVLDRMSLLHRIRLVHPNNEIVKGKVEIVNQETEWRFIPKDKWEEGVYIVQINSRLEDPAGNNLNGLLTMK